jgi:hypothetical protein
MNSRITRRENKTGSQGTVIDAEPKNNLYKIYINHRTSRITKYPPPPHNSLISQAGYFKDMEKAFSYRSKNPMLD